jgi:ABC-type multidrug transport system ATPase subunit
MTEENLIEVHDVSKTFGSYLAVDHLSMNVRCGEIVVLLGQTGAGKSTILNLIMGTMAPSSGVIRVAGVDPYASFKALRGCWPSVSRPTGYCPGELRSRTPSWAFSFSASPVRRRAERPKNG